MKVRRSRVYPFSPEAVWDIVGDPGQLGEWWPRVERIESRNDTGFTEVYMTKKGRPVRADFRIATLEDLQEIRVVQQLAGTPFARVFASSSKRVAIEAAGEGTKVEAEIQQSPAGMAKLGGFMVRPALKKQLDGGLDALGELLATSA